MPTVTYQHTKLHTQRHYDSSKTDHKSQKVGSGPICVNPQPFPQNTHPTH